jgi:hypothetical protein
MPTDTSSVPGRIRSERDDLRVMVVGLAVVCPYSLDNPCFCPLCDVRKLPLEQRMAWVDAQPIEELRRIFSEHRRCLIGREAGL